MASERGLTMTRGRTKTSYSMPALEAAEFAEDHGHALDFHRAMFKAYFTDLQDIADLDVIGTVAESVGLDGAELRRALDQGAYREQVLQGIEWSRAIGVTGIPTYIFQEQWGIPGAQDYAVFQSIMERLGKTPRANGN